MGINVVFGLKRWIASGCRPVGEKILLWGQSADLKSPSAAERLSCIVFQSEKQEINEGNKDSPAHIPHSDPVDPGPGGPDPIDPGPGGSDPVHAGPDSLSGCCEWMSARWAGLQRRSISIRSLTMWDSMCLRMQRTPPARWRNTRPPGPAGSRSAPACVRARVKLKSEVGFQGGLLADAKTNVFASSWF